MPSERGNTLDFNQYMKSNKIPYIIYADIESLIKKSRWMCKQSGKFFNDKNKRANALWIFNANCMSF